MTVPEARRVLRKCGPFACGPGNGCYEVFAGPRPDDMTIKEHARVKKAISTVLNAAGRKRKVKR